MQVKPRPVKWTQAVSITKRRSCHLQYNTFQVQTYAQIIQANAVSQLVSRVSLVVHIIRPVHNSLVGFGSGSYSSSHACESGDRLVDARMQLHFKQAYTCTVLSLPCFKHFFYKSTWTHICARQMANLHICYPWFCIFQHWSCTHTYCNFKLIL